MQFIYEFNCIADEILTHNCPVECHVGTHTTEHFIEFEYS